jgi:glycosyltransferase involved in cell wall biosynthesis
VKILYDHQIFSLQKYGGITRYFCELILNLPDEHHYILSLVFSDNHYLKENSSSFKKLDILPDKVFKGKPFIKRNIYSINKLYSQYCLSTKDFDLFHPTYYNRYFLKLLKKPYVLTIHDLIVFKHRNASEIPDFMMSQMKDVIKNANRLIAISENTKKDLIEILNVNPDKIDVIYHGYSGNVSNNKTENNDRYILYVGRRGEYKNFRTFVQAISPLLKREKDLQLICAGDPFEPEEMMFLAKLGISNQTLALTIGDDKLNKLYSNALVFVFPSLYEGFGLPILEAFANSCPVCLSNTSCFPEIAGIAGAYFDPYDYESILSAIEKVIYDNDYAKSLIREGHNRLKKYSWTKTVEETLETYKKVF